MEVKLVVNEEAANERRPRFVYSVVVDGNVAMRDVALSVAEAFAKGISYGVMLAEQKASEHNQRLASAFGVQAKE